MPSLPHETDAVKAAADIVSVIGEYVPLKRNGRTQVYSGLCPFHTEKTPSFRVDGRRQRYHCFGCGADGDVFAFIQAIERSSFVKAKRQLAERFGVPLSDKPLSKTEKQRYARAREQAGVDARKFVSWRRKLIDGLRRARNLCWETEQAAVRLGRDYWDSLSEADWDTVFEAVKLQRRGDVFNRTLNKIENASIDVLLVLWKQERRRTA